LLQKFPDLVIYLLAIILVSVIARPPYLLNNPVSRYLGKISYSLYVSHAYVGSVIWPHVAEKFLVGPLPIMLTLQLVLAVVFASALHFAVERPFLRLKRRLHQARSAARSESERKGLCF
jgi:peptidoglycan/LPS O-acetylase OafA/YrhL